MSQSCLHVIAFALVAVLCVCKVTSASVATVQEPEIYTTQKSSTLHGNELKKPVSVSDSVNTPQETTTSPDTTTLHSTNNTHEDDQNSIRDPLYPDITRESTITESTSTQSTTTQSATTKSATTQSATKQSATKQSAITQSAITQSAIAGTQSDSGGKIAGVFFLIFIFIIIIILAGVLYILWKKGKRYSFDLTNDEHETLPIDQIGTFEQAKGSTMNLDQEDYPNKSSPVANGCSGETPEQTPYSEQQSAPEEDSFSSDLSELNSPVKKVEFNLDLELIGVEPELEKPEADEPADNDNENNNNETNTGNDSADLFTEINLDDTQ